LDAESNFSPIGNQNLIEHVGSELSVNGEMNRSSDNQQ